jgi:hypothetical protein
MAKLLMGVPGSLHLQQKEYIESNTVIRGAFAFVTSSFSLQIE